MKLRRSAGTKCFVATLNSSESALPEAVLNATATVSNNMMMAKKAKHQTISAIALFRWLCRVG